MNALKGAAIGAIIGVIAGFFIIKTEGNPDSADGFKLLAGIGAVIGFVVGLKAGSSAKGESSSSYSSSYSSGAPANGGGSPLTSLLSVPFKILAIPFKILGTFWKWGTTVKRQVHQPKSEGWFAKVWREWGERIPICKYCNMQLPSGSPRVCHSCGRTLW